jgi:hypothetical protein
MTATHAGLWKMLAAGITRALWLIRQASVCVYSRFVALLWAVGVHPRAWRARSPRPHTLVADAAIAPLIAISLPD